MELYTTVLLARWAIAGLRAVGVRSDELDQYAELLVTLDRWVRIPHDGTLVMANALHGNRDPSATAIDIGLAVTDEDLYVARYVIATAPDLRSALDSGTKLGRALTNSLSVAVTERPDGDALLSLTAHTSDLPVDALEFALGVCLRFVFAAVGTEAVTEVWTPRTGDVSWPEELAHAKKVTSAPFTAAVIGAEHLDRPMPTADALIHDWALRLLPADRPSGLSDSAYLFLGERLGRERCDLADFAAHVSYSVRSVQRQLGEEGTSYEAIRDHVRRDRAFDLLRSSQPIAEIAASLGYDSPAGFARAFRRWTGRTPSEFRIGEAAS